MSREPKLDIHQEITSRIVAAIEDGAGEFRLPWNRGGASGRPRNIASGKCYNGVNVLALWVAALHQGYARPIWGTYRQWQEKGCQVKRGEKSSLVVFYKSFTVETDREDASESATAERFVARASFVFNADQVEGYAAPAEHLPATPLFSPIEEAERFLAASGARVTEGGTHACYRPSTDDILMPDRTRFLGTDSMSAGEAFYATLMHELTHWTGHPTRCARDLKNRFGSQSYVMEELVAELGAAFLCADLGVTPELRPDHAGYIANWLTVLKSDKKAIFTAASKAQQAVNLLASLAGERP
jgi:antirestriction protein ArdC